MAENNFEISEPNVPVSKCSKSYRKFTISRHLLTELLYDYAKNSTLHGLRYIVERGLPILERVFWIFTCLLSMSICFFLITKVWIKWKTSPTIIGISDSFIPVVKVPFPSITICPQNKVKASVYNYTKASMKYGMLVNNDEPYKGLREKYQNSSDKNFAKYKDVSDICNKYTGPMREANERVNVTFIEHLYEVSPTVDDVFLSCDWAGISLDCFNIMNAVLTSEGLCYNFNVLAADEILNLESLQKDYYYLNSTERSKNWSIRNGYTSSKSDDVYPRRGKDYTGSPDLFLTLQTDTRDIDKICTKTERNSYKIFIQNPTDMPQTSTSHHYTVYDNHMVSLGVKFNVITTKNSLLSYYPETRQCYISEDGKLKYFKIYTESNCKLECHSNYTYEICGCVSFHMPHNDSRSLCTYRNNGCVAEALEDMMKAQTYDEDEPDAPCNCLPACDAIYYDAEVLKTELLNFDVTEFANIFQPQLGENTFNFARVGVFFKQPRFQPVMRRSGLFGVTDFLANCGGLLGLFLGFSFISLIEIFYFGSFRLFSILKKDSQTQTDD